MGEPPQTYRVNPQGARAELDYADMIALSGMFRRWAIHEDEGSVTPAQRTRLIELSADYERVAEWVGVDWLADNPSLEPPLLKFLATRERAEDNVTGFVGARRLVLRSWRGAAKRPTQANLGHLRADQIGRSNRSRRPKRSIALYPDQKLAAPLRACRLARPPLEAAQGS